MADSILMQLSPFAQRVRQGIAQGTMHALFELPHGEPVGPVLATVEDFDAAAAGVIAGGLRDMLRLRFHEEL